MVKKVQKLHWRHLVLRSLVFGLVVGSIAFLYWDKTRTHDYVCQVVGFEPESGMLGMRCMMR